MSASLLAETRAILNRYGFRPKKKLGQNFLVDRDLQERIVEAAESGPQETIIEIGPGLGILTRALCQTAGLVLAIEIDTTLFGILRKELAGFSNLSLVQADVLTFDFGAWAREKGVAGGVKVVANLPYYISTSLLFHLLRSRHLFSLLVLMVQKEVGERILAQPGSKQYGSLSIALQLYAEPKIWTSAPQEAFYPSPQVDSVVLKILIRQKPRVEVGNESLFRSVVRAAFAQRRKMLGNALPGQICSGMPKDVWDRVFLDAELSQKRRGETLSIEEFATLTHHLNGWLEREGYVPHRQG
jgi:16S rRNA (adenine1518-N6/adenine1519-N6)-dimethyltransferase